MTFAGSNHGEHHRHHKPEYDQSHRSPLQWKNFRAAFFYHDLRRAPTWAPTIYSTSRIAEHLEDVRFSYRAGAEGAAVRGRVKETTTERCLLCGRTFEYGHDAWQNGRWGKAWQQIIGSACDQRDGLVPNETIITTLKSRGIEPRFNSDGYIVVPPN